MHIKEVDWWRYDKRMIMWKTSRQERVMMVLPKKNWVLPTRLTQWCDTYLVVLSL